MHVNKYNNNNKKESIENLGVLCSSLELCSLEAKSEMALPCINSTLHK